MNTEANYDNTAVDQFAQAMKDKLAVARGKGRGGWMIPEECTLEHLADLLVQHVAKGDPVDVANFCMMLHHRGVDSALVAETFWNFVWKFVWDAESLDPVLAKFYNVETPKELIEAMEKHIQKLQAKLPKTEVPINTPPRQG